MNAPDPLPSVNDYERAVFFQVVKRSAKPVLGLGWVITRKDLKAAFFAVNPEYADAPMANTLYDMMVYPALKIEVQENGFVVYDHQNKPGDRPPTRI